MLDVTLDLITQTASSSLFAFCFCNLIIVIIILVGSKPGSEFGHEDKNSPLLVLEASNTSTNDDQEEKEINNPKGFCEERNDLQVVTEVESAVRLLVVEEECVGEDEDEDEEGDGIDDDDDDELRKRFEEFIQKVNTGWKAELSKNSNLIEV